MDHLDFNCIINAAKYDEICSDLVCLNPPTLHTLAETVLTTCTVNLASVEIVGGGVELALRQYLCNNIHKTERFLNC